MQTLSHFPVEELSSKVIMVRLDPVILLQESKENPRVPTKALSTIKYLYNASSKLILVGSWGEGSKSGFHSEACHSTESVAGVTIVSVLFLTYQFLH